MSVGTGGQLFPGINDDITLELITPKLSWRDFYVLRSVSSTWQQAIQSHMIYESRVRSKSTETLAIVAGSALHSSIELSLFSSRDGTWSSLPSNPYVPEGILQRGQCISLDGKLYAVGGLKRHRREHTNTVGRSTVIVAAGSAKVYVLDMAGQRQWKKCADMREPRLDFACGVINGKIYVFGGSSDGKPASASEVYDPTVDTWSTIKPMMTSRVRHCVFNLGHELFVYGGCDSATISEQDEDEDKYEFLLWTKPALCLEAYNPVKDEWRLISKESFGQRVKGMKVFTSEDKIYAINRESCIEVYDIDEEAWTPVQPYINQTEDFISSRWPSYHIGVGNEVLGIVCGYLKGTGQRFRGLIRSRGFGNVEEDVVWEFIRAGPRSLGDPVAMWAIEI